MTGQDAAGHQAAPSAAHPAQPNIVVVVADDLGWADLGCYGSSFHETSALDGLADRGARFTDAYAAAPVCSPTRASLMTGKYPATVGVTQFIGGHLVGRLCDVPYFPYLPSSEYSLARALRDGGYQTWHVGKWHLGSRPTWPDRHGFEVNVGGCDWGFPKNGYLSPYGCPTLSDGPDGEYLTDRLTSEAVELIENAGDRPFFLNLWHYAVHTPIQAPAGLVEKYRLKAAHLGLDTAEPFEDGEPIPTWSARGQRVKRRRLQSDPTYAAMVENLDSNVGRLLDALERTGNAENTLVIFTSDNGGLSTAEGAPTCNAPLAEGKGWMYEGGTRVPLIAHWPGVIRPRTVVDEPVTSPDLYPTVVEAAGLALRPEQGVEGMSLVPLLDGRSVDPRPLFWHYPHYANQGNAPAAAVREGDWKLIHVFEDHRTELYQVREDPGERVDLADRELGRVARLQTMLESWQRSVNALVPRPNPYQPFTDVPAG